MATDINKATIMNMLRTDVFGFSNEEIECAAKEVFTLTSDGKKPSTSKNGKKSGYARNDNGCIIIHLRPEFLQKLK